jgi:hypothetical protein
VRTDRRAADISCARDALGSCNQIPAHIVDIARGMRKAAVCPAAQKRKRAVVKALPRFVIALTNAAQQLLGRLDDRHDAARGELGADSSDAGHLRASSGVSYLRDARQRLDVDRHAS